MYDTEFAGDRDLEEDDDAKVTISSRDKRNKRDAWNRRMASAIRRYRRNNPGSLSLSQATSASPMKRLQITGMAMNMMWPMTKQK